MALGSFNFAPFLGTALALLVADKGDVPYNMDTYDLYVPQLPQPIRGSFSKSACLIFERAPICQKTCYAS